jgi:hypothetical protein
MGGLMFIASGASIYALAIRNRRQQSKAAG